MIIAENAQKFKSTYAAAMEFNKKKRLSLTLEESLEFYIEEHCFELNQEECFLKIKSALHLDALRSIADIWFRKLDKKKHLVWLHGENNSGKSTIIKYC